MPADLWHPISVHHRLYGRIIIAAIWIALIPVLGKYIILAISALLIFTVSSNFLIIAGFAACMVIFVFPLFLLGTVTPSLVKYTVDNLDDNGKLVGNLNASNTIGIFLLCVILGHDNSFAFWKDDLKYEGESVYNYLQVYEDDKEVVLSTNVLFGVQSVYKKENGLTGMYYDYAMAAPFMAGINDKRELNILILGNGTGTYATQCTRYFDNVMIAGVEIDQKITDLVVKYFELPENVDVTTYDGRAYLNTIHEKNVDMLEVFGANFDFENNEEIRIMMNRVNSELVKYVPGNYVMTDDKAPVELLGMKAIDELIRDEVAYYKQIYRDGGLKTLLEKL